MLHPWAGGYSAKSVALLVQAAGQGLSRTLILEHLLGSAPPRILPGCSLRCWVVPQKAPVVIGTVAELKASRTPNRQEQESKFCCYLSGFSLLCLWYRETMIIIVTTILIIFIECLRKHSSKHFAYMNSLNPQATSRTSNRFRNEIT